MADSRHNTGYEPSYTKQKTCLSEADRAQKHLMRSQPGRVLIEKIHFQPRNRGGQGLLPRHSHNVATDVIKGTSIQRYDPVRLVNVPAKEKAAWLLAIKRKVKNIPLLAQKFDPAKLNYAALKCTHSCHSYLLIREGNRTYMNKPGDTKFQLRPGDVECHLIQAQGV